MKSKINVNRRLKTIQLILTWVAGKTQSLTPEAFDFLYVNKLFDREFRKYSKLLSKKL